eukprot:162091_1
MTNTHLLLLVLTMIAQQSWAFGPSPISRRAMVQSTFSSTVAIIAAPSLVYANDANDVQSGTDEVDAVVMKKSNTDSGISSSSTAAMEAKEYGRRNWWKQEKGWLNRRIERENVAKRAYAAAANDRSCDEQNIIDDGEDSKYC